MRVKYVPAEIAIARFAGPNIPKRARDANENAIMRNKEDSGIAAGGYKITTDLVKVVEAWHLPSGWGAKDGKHIICVKGRTLTPKEEWGWDKDRFPFAFFKWSEPVIGWYPQGLVEQQEPVQYQENKLLKRIQDAMNLYSVANTYYETGAIKNKKHWKNESGNLIEIAKGAKVPITNMPSSINSEVFRFVWELHQKIFENTGVSMMSAASIKPPGIESGRGLMVLRDTESGRHALTNTGFDDYHMEAAELTVDAAKEVYKNKGSYKVNYVGKDKVERIDWSKVDMERDLYEITVFPTSQLPHEPAGRLERVERLKKGGFIDNQQALVLLGMPDLEQFASLENATYEDIEMQIDKILVEDDYREPMEYQDLQLGMAMMTSAILRAEQQNAPQERIEKLMEWIEQAKALEDARMAEEARIAAEAQAAAQPPPAGPGPGPGLEGLPPGTMPPGMPPGGLPPMS
jgi:hypothetical protein